MNLESSYNENFDLDSEKLHDECGILGIFLNKPESDSEAAMLSYYGLYSLQHRGQESAGIAVSDGETVSHYKNMGILADVFTTDKLTSLKGNIAVGQVLYAKAKDRIIENAQPFVNHTKLGTIAVSFNGSLVNYDQLKEFLEETGSTFGSTSHTEVIVKLMAKNYKKGMDRALADTIQLIKGGYALTIMTEKTLVGARDPNGIRPLCLGKLPNGWVLASENCAFDAIGAELVRDIKPGEIVIINEDGVLSFEFGEHTTKSSCVFEYVYFARPDSVIDEISVQEARIKMGEVLARESGVDADVVIGVPDSGLGAALGYSKESGIPYAMGIVKNKYIGRTFIAPTQKERERLVFVKLNAMKSDLDGKRVVVIDDSIVRGTTSRRLIQILRRAGAKEVHFRISSPPVKFPCHFGIDTPSKADLISSQYDVEQVRKEIGADTLAFISIEGMFEALKGICPSTYGYCEGCFTGKYPVSVPCDLHCKLEK